MGERVWWSIAGGFAGGIFLRSLINLGWIAITALLCVAIILALIALVARARTPLVMAIVFVAGAAGMLRFSFAEQRIVSPQLALHENARVTLEGIIDEEPDVREGRVLVRVLPDHINTTPLATQTHILVIAGEYPRLAYGDRVSLKGVLELPQPIENGNRTFNYPQYLAVRGIVYQMRYPRVELMGSNEGNPIMRALFNIKESFTDRLSRAVPKPESALLSGILVGGSQSLGTTLTDALRAAGVIHIVALSGYNVTIVAESIMQMLAFLPIALARSLGVASVILFALMTGAGATIVRAAIMALIVVLARATGRPYDMARALFLAGVAMIAVNPHLLVFDLSFQLSFLATLGLIYLSPWFEKLFSRVTARFGLRGILSATIATQILVFPLILFAMGKMSVIGVVTNLLVLPAIPAAMLAGFLAGAGMFIHAMVALPFAFFGYVLAKYVLTVSAWFGALPFAQVDVPWFTAPFLAGTYLVLFSLIYLRSRAGASSSSTSSSRSTSALLR
ncbi:MAG: hypothetical protein A2675_01830 [Candidatus Yonathbacteria bacterium RIFCSPHIGHO2_01_FULL_51_10]|uniref:ComEC/Rec2-related protein domain-containing protein n=1 Tax=Candidatus Yonathbacteria bacterium RIFCSPHIGHO2_01_FULL_51_10 TaxID=1802723 RepID=A0A1G2S9W9_9BACT|nr:MAG: hypothetical protein A2675_01830 [Candidatus Yonathbacteria bacterium RIFCSPHIGHO2_01_FULL_51_10]